MRALIEKTAGLIVGLIAVGLLFAGGFVLIFSHGNIGIAAVLVALALGVVFDALWFADKRRLEKGRRG